MAEAARAKFLKSNLKDKVAAFGRSLQRGVQLQRASDGVEVTVTVDSELMNLTVEQPDAASVRSVQFRTSVQFALARTEVLMHSQETADGLGYQQITLIEAEYEQYSLRLADPNEAQNFYTCLTLMCLAANHKQASTAVSSTPLLFEF